MAVRPESPATDVGLTAARVAALRRSVSRWGSANHRALPWRATRDPWAVLVSEVMLQQTQVARVLESYRRFLVRFPDPAACGAAPAAEVVRAWAGLGYNRRALNLHRAATVVVARHGGRIPSDLDQLLALPGIGAYTARAVQAFAFEADSAVVDTNVARVLSRAVAGRPLNAAHSQHLADRLVPPGRAWAWNQAMLDLGAGCCRARSPYCSACPLRRSCRWAASGWAEPDPARASAGTARPQARFAGSDRQARGRLVAALRQAPVPPDQLAAVLGLEGDPERASRVVERLVDEGLVGRDGSGRFSLA